MIEKITPLKKNTKKIIKQDQFNVLTFNIPRREKKLSEWMNEFFPPSLATILNVILPIWLIIQLFQIKQPHPLKVIPILLNLNKWYHHWPFFFVQKCTNYQMVCHPCEEKYETSLFKWWFKQRQKCEQNFSFGLNVGVFLKTTKGTFLIIKEKKIHRKKKLFCYFCSSPPTGFLHSGSKKHYPSLWNYLFLWFFLE